ncbi:hypothetical protein SeMB42_g06989 [Synchytrium endobioticum]|uniref:Casein kinase II subunit beta n=1 Tax=Synchytrium endobioticum TaxID=286115 RepID=A0A507C5M5_9FUNG|nr:hypothetical protein SeMB42_g06989 [Synchytrium endobioticum]
MRKSRPALVTTASNRPLLPMPSANTTTHPTAKNPRNPTASNPHQSTPLQGRASHHATASNLPSTAASSRPPPMASPAQTTRVTSTPARPETMGVAAGAMLYQLMDFIHIHPPPPPPDDPMDGAYTHDDEQDEKVSGDSFVSTTTTGTSSSLVSWITWYCSLPGHELFVQVPEEFIEDDFNLTNLQNAIPLYSAALDMILDMEPTSPCQNTASSVDTAAQATQAARPADVEASAEVLYGLLHARYIVTKPGLQTMADRLSHGEFGKCPRSGCVGAYVLPCGRSDGLGADTVKMFCPRCCDLYHPRETRYHRIDGAFFGTTFPHVLFLSFPELIPPVISRPRSHKRIHHPTSESASESDTNPHNAAYQDNRMSNGELQDLDEDEAEEDEMDQDENEEEQEQDEEEEEEDEKDDTDGNDDNGQGTSSRDPDQLRRSRIRKLPDYYMYESKIFGFRVSERASNGPRMQWLRWREPLPIPGSDRMSRSSSSGSGSQRHAAPFTFGMTDNDDDDDDKEE